MKRVGCIIVTFNKLELLKECINAVLNQTVKVDKIFIVDNASTDNTRDYVEQLTKKYNNIIYSRLEKNMGGAGGFNYGLKLAYKADIDYIWIMDDDTIPKKDSLENLLRFAIRDDINWGFLSSNVKWIDDSPCLMNIPEPDKLWSEYIIDGLVRVVSATFVSLFIKKEILKEVGFPISEFFIWGDDTEFTKRISKKKYPGYMVSTSVVTHKMAKNIDVDIINDTKDRLNRYYYRYRNKVYTAKKSGVKEFIQFFLHTSYTILRILKEKNTNKFKKIQIVIKGYFAGLFFNPSIEFPDSLDT
ncbi:glycosyltransferase family 2 protein [Aeribacillus sp. FSL k6-2211]|uniref:glycosyltransferase family 2 protein n=1 Tax=Aeribacillus sp. FSL k6-2211 TaxID=2954608 RepID=UPI0030D0E760